MKKIKETLNKNITFVGWKYILNQIFLFLLGGLYVFLDMYISFHLF